MKSKQSLDLLTFRRSDMTPGAIRFWQIHLFQLFVCSIVEEPLFNHKTAQITKTLFQFIQIWIIWIYDKHDL